MTDNRIVIIRSEPRCGSAWLANFLNHGDVVAVHEGINGCSSLEEYEDEMESLAEKNLGKLIIDVTTAPKFVVNRLPYEVVFEVRYKIFNQNGWTATEAMLSPLFDKLCIPYDWCRLHKLYPIRVTRNLDSIDKEAGLAFIESLKPKSEEPTPMNNFDYEGASLHEILNNLHQRVLNGECSEEMSKMLDHAMYLVETAQGCLGGVSTKEVDRDGWIKWGGGHCPVPPSTRVNVKFRNDKTNDKGIASNWVWEDDIGEYTIVAYRVIG